MRFLARCVAAIVVLAISIEIALQLAALVVRDRQGVARTAAITILCVGDSHTYGGGVAADMSYPAWLQRFLDRKAPGRFAVVNAGLPGANTAMTRRRLPVLVQRYEPDVILGWVGINDAWNLTESEPDEWSERLDAWASWSRLYRLVRVRLHDRLLDQALAAPAQSVALAGGVRPVMQRTDTHFEIYTEDGRVERVPIAARNEMATDPVTTRRLAANYAAMIAWAKTAGIPIGFVAYPARILAFDAANAALRSAASPAHVPVLETTATVETVPVKRRQFLWAAHPNEWMYRAIARRLAERILRACATDRCQWQA